MVALPTITGLPDTTKDSFVTAYQSRHEREGILVTIGYTGEHALPTSDITVDGDSYRMVQRQLMFRAEEITETRYLLRPMAPVNRLSFMSVEDFTRKIQTLIVLVAGSDVGFDRDKSSWTGYMSWLLNGAPAAPTFQELLIIRRGEALIDLLLTDLLPTDDDSEIGFQQATQVLEDYGIGVSESGEIYELDNDLGEVTDLIFANVEIEDDGIDYNKVPIGCRYEDATSGGITATLVMPPETDNSKVRWVSEMMPTREQAHLEIELQRRLISQGARNAEFELIMNKDILPRTIITHRDIKYMVVRAIHSYFPEEVNTSEVVAWRV